MARTAIIYKKSQVVEKERALAFYETYLATKTYSALTRTWLFEAHVDSQRPSRAQSSPCQRALEINRVGSRRGDPRDNHGRGAPLRVPWNGNGVAHSKIEDSVALKRALRLRKSSEFQRVRQQGRSTASRLLILAWTPNEVARLRVGFVVSKRISK